jgi:microcystin degradation protein MlrC
MAAKNNFPIPLPFILDGATGTELSKYRILCLKSANHFRGFFQPRADAIVTADPPGLRCSDLRTYHYRNMRSPLYPLDENTTFMGE